VVPTQADGTLLHEDVYRRAAVLGRTAAGVSGPNPPVGCVLVLDGEIIGEGATAPAGGPHAEIVALSAAGERARGATAVVTLEPCAHHGRTGPCVDALVEAGVAAVHLVLRDPDPQAAGGAERLRAAGVTVVEVADRLPAIAGAVAHDLRGFVARVRSGRPHLILKLAQTVDGRTAPGPSGYLTGVEARTRVHRLRADVDAVLVGSGTVRADDPLLDVRHVPSERAPRPVVLATEADVDPAARVIGRGALVLVGPQAPASRCAVLERSGATVVPVPLARDGGRGLALDAGLAALLEHRILTVLAEPGPTLSEALLAGGLVDELEIHVAATKDARDVVPAIGRLASVLDAWRDGDASSDVLVAGDDVVIRAALSDLMAMSDHVAEVA
jgi:diaminohydroxyphosphoribosylaminopyrimidine deaminase/5-amino-6-(5-phosphoribosylamino)uracil reductase